MSYSYECEAWQIDVAEEEDDGENLIQLCICPVFSIEIFANIVPNQPTINQQLLLPQNQLTQPTNTTSWSAISSKLSQMQVPFNLHATVTRKIIECARAASIDTKNKNRSNIPIVVIVGPVRSAEEELEAVFSEVRGASKAAIEALNNVEAGEEFTGNCVICLEEMLDRLKANRMPCSHVFHQDCIVGWLGTAIFVHFVDFGCLICRLLIIPFH